MSAEKLQTVLIEEIRALGFNSPSPPRLNLAQALRPAHEIAARLLALDALCCWIYLSEEQASSLRLNAFLDRNQLAESLTDHEAAILFFTRAEAQAAHIATLGLRLETMWALAWVLGFEPEVPVVEPLITSEITRQIVYDFLPGLDGQLDLFLAGRRLRSDQAVIDHDYRLRLAENALATTLPSAAQFPTGVIVATHGRAVAARRHALSWTMAPGVSWDELERQG